MPNPCTGRGPPDPGKRMVGRALIRKIGRKALPSKVQAADQLFDRSAQLAGHVLEDLPQGADPQGLVGWTSEVLLLIVRASAEPHVTTCLTR
jgi:hypothetical protein